MEATAEPDEAGEIGAATVSVTATTEAFGGLELVVVTRLVLADKASGGLASVIIRVVGAGGVETWGAVSTIALQATLVKANIISMPTKNSDFHILLLPQ